jgi:hypothetical protein
VDLGVSPWVVTTTAITVTAASAVVLIVRGAVLAASFDEAKLVLGCLLGIFL